VRAHALPLQILLAFALILNGIAGAMASVAAFPPPAVAQRVIETGPAATMAGDCAGHDGPDATASVPMPPADDCHSGDGPGCDHGAQCLHACMHAPAVVEPLLSLVIVQSGTDAVLHPLADGHPAPPLGNPTRPPIA
jgi:hypothetical protein